LGPHLDRWERQRPCASAASLIWEADASVLPGEKFAPSGCLPVGIRRSTVRRKSLQRKKTVPLTRG